MPTKICTQCLVEKPVSAFGASTRTKTGVVSQCRVCDNVRNRKRSLIRKFGINEDIYNDLFLKQKGCCAICKRHQAEFGRRLAVDHNHKTNIVRGLLCTECNTGLGKFKDNKTLIQEACNYLSE